LDARRADAAGRAMHEDAFTRAQSTLGEQRVVGGGEHLREPAGLGPVDAVGHGHGNALVGHRELGLATTSDERHYAVADGEAEDPGPRRHDLAGELHPGDVGRAPGRRRVQP
jgi:hypothetical protein